MSDADMDTPTKAALENTARRFFDMTARGDAFSLKQNAIPSLASNFRGVEAAIIQDKENFAAAQATVRGSYLLDAPGNAPIARAEFFCGVFNSPDRVAFVIPNLPPGRYAVAILDVAGKKAPETLTLVLQEIGGAWKLAGFNVRQTQISGHDGQWFLSKAREFARAGQKHNAWLYYFAAWKLMAPADFMYTTQKDKLADEMQQVRPADMPGQSPVDVLAAGSVFRVTDIDAVPVGNDLYVRATYQAAADISDNTKSFQNNMALTKALVAKYPEFRSAFAGIATRAMDASGRDYGSLLAMKDVK
jgi:hypothetical protein